jgi:1-acyl-sn-glycerol-3-phosphate acyltransferase
MDDVLIFSVSMVCMGALVHLHRWRIDAMEASMRKTMDDMSQLENKLRFILAANHQGRTDLPDLHLHQGE